MRFLLMLFRSSLQILLIIFRDKESIYNYQTICDALRDLVVFLLFWKREKYPWSSVKSNTPPFLNYTGATKSSKTSLMISRFFHLRANTGKNVSWHNNMALEMLFNFVYYEISFLFLIYLDSYPVCFVFASIFAVCH